MGERKSKEEKEKNNLIQCFIVLRNWIIINILLTVVLIILVIMNG